MAQFKIDPNYVDVAARMQEFFDKHPEGSFQTVDKQLMSTQAGEFIVYTAAAYRTPDDPRPGHGTAWEPVPGTTPYTKNSELMNAETSAWGRAIIAVGASTSKKIASANEVRNRSAEREEHPPIVQNEWDEDGTAIEEPQTVPYGLANNKQITKLRLTLRDQNGITDNDEVHAWCSRTLGMQVESLKHLSGEQISKCISRAEGRAA
jgi:hypothetical protein